MSVVPHLTASMRRYWAVQNKNQGEIW